MAKRKSTSDVFDFEKFFKKTGIEAADRKAVAVCFEVGLEHYHRHLYGYAKYGKRPGFLLEERMWEPYIFGFGAVEAARQDTLSVETRLRIVQYALQSMDVTKEFGVPHGLPVMVSFLARAGRLRSGVFRSAMLAADFAGSMFDDWRPDEAQRLFDWVVAEHNMPMPERIWWLWHICVNCEDRQMAGLLADCLLAHRDITAKTKRLICRAWLADTSLGDPPAQWQALQALLSGDMDTFAARAAEAGLPPIDTLPSREAIEAEYDSALEILSDENVYNDFPADLSLQLFRKTILGPLGMAVVTPPALKRVAILALPELGQDPLAVCETYLASDKGYYGDVINQAVVEVIRTYPLHFPRRSLRALIERGLGASGAATRRMFYQLGGDLIGRDCLEMAKRDRAKSIRDWAKEKLKNTGRKTRLKTR